MNGELAQIICLTTRGSTWLADASRAALPALDRDNSTFQYVGSLQFRFRDGQAGPESRAETVTDWLLQVRQRRVERLWLVIPGMQTGTPEGQTTGDHELAGFANAGRWRLVTAGGRQPEAWRASWTVGDRNAAKNRIWAVHYEGEPAGEVLPQRPDLRVAGEQLRKSLRSAREFAARHGLDTWAAWFDRALASIDIPYHPDMLPAAYTPQSRHLAAAAAQAWVFGGMGSWNDIGFVDGAVQSEYRELSGQLYAATLQALLASANDGLHAADDDR